MDRLEATSQLQSRLPSLSFSTRDGYPACVYVSV
uniref:Uncharacterized protein n=1 Tax=Astatotilapia calliptera TaxID=8154 RepID=A0AAX7V210_ASTCA